LEERYEIRLSGSGGQGLILAGVILAEAAIIDGKNVVQTQSYGPEARGGASRSEIVMSQGEIYYPETTKLDLLLAMSQEACDKYHYDLKEDGLLIVDSSLVSYIPTSYAQGFPFTRLAKERLGRGVVANIIALGALVGLTHILSPKALEEAVITHVPPETRDLNLKALKLGLKIGKEARAKERRVKGRGRKA